MSGDKVAHIRTCLVLIEIFFRDLRDVLVLLTNAVPGFDKLLGALNIPVFRPDQTAFLQNIIAKTIQLRKTSGVR